MDLYDTVWSRPLLVEATTVREMFLPTNAELRIALCAGSEQGPVCREAHTLTQLHRSRREKSANPLEIDSRRAESVSRIDAWVTDHTRDGRASASPRIDSLGALIDRMAEVAEDVLHNLATGGPTSGAVHLAWIRLQELEIRYSKVTGAVLSGRGWS